MTDWTTKYDPAISLLGIYSREMKTYVHTDNYASVHRSIIHNNPKLISNTTAIN